jgi:hypothetical protein
MGCQRGGALGSFRPAGGHVGINSTILEKNAEVGGT